VVTPGSVGDWTQASIMAAALAGLAATCWRALREEDAQALARSPTGLVDATAAAENVEAVQ
jgi:hypothetical protein